MGLNIRRAAVIGAGIMGAGIAANSANAGIPVLLLDVVPPDAQDSSDRAARNRIAQSGLEKALKAKPAPAFFSPRDARLVTVGNTEDDFDKLGEVDWIVEAVVERLDVKHEVYARIERVRQPDAVVSSNTSGLPASMLVEGRGEDFQRHFLITHYYNPVRFMKLLELIPSPRTDPAIMREMGAFCSERLGKGVVYCKDTPNFIGNRIGTFGFMATVRRMLDEGYKVEEVDAITGPAMGHARSATFRTADLAGIDTLVHVADNLYANLPEDPHRQLFTMPPFVREMVARGWLGDKTGQGFYKKVRDAGGNSEVLALDPASLEYRPQDSVHFSSLDTVKGMADPGERARTLLSADDRAARLAWELTADTLSYTAEIADQISDDVVNIDNALRWGFNWDLGPFETLDLIGVESFARRLEAEGRPVPPLIERVRRNGTSAFYTDGADRRFFDWNTGSYQPVPEGAPRLSLTSLKRAGKTVKENRSASLIDLGDGVLGVEFHAKMNAIDDEIVAMLRAAVEEAQRNWRAIVVGNEAPDFCVGANLAQVLMGAKMRMWPALEKATAAFQQANLAFKYSAVPVVVAPAGRTLGGGAEIVMHGHAVRAAAETYLGLVEVGAGLIPAGGGCKELLARWQTMTPEHGPFPAARHAFEVIAVATVSTSAPDARSYGFLKKSDAITLDRERLLADAKADALALADAKDQGRWAPPTPPTFRLPGAGGRLVLEQVIEGLRETGKASEHDAVVSGKLAYVLTGGDCSPLDEITEQQILDLEREAFVSLAGMPKTQERMDALLKTGKPLRN
jgi:3-hydroxyacyl-CoA dehydrogenase